MGAPKLDDTPTAQPTASICRRSGLESVDLLWVYYGYTTGILWVYYGLLWLYYVLLLYLQA